MFAIERPKDKMIINCRQTGDYPIKKLKELEMTYSSTPRTAKDTRRDLRKLIQIEKNRKNEWRKKHLTNCILPHLGGKLHEYKYIELPDNERELYLRAIYIEKQGKNLKYTMPPGYEIQENSTIHIKKQWVKGNYAFDETWLYLSELKESENFLLAFFQNNVSQQIGCELFLWKPEIEDCAPLEIKGWTYLYTLCHGSYNAETQQAEVTK